MNFEEMNLQDMDLMNMTSYADNIKEIEASIQQVWESKMSLYRGEMPDEFLAMCVDDVWETANQDGWHDGDIEMAMQRTIMTLIERTYS